VKFQIPVAGRWYFALMFMIGGVSLTSLNNVVYLMEALLISGLVISATLSMKTARSVTVEVSRRPIQAGGDNHDLIHVVNHSRFPVFCLEIDEWTGGKPKRLAFIPCLRGRSTVQEACRAIYDERGRWSWDAISVGTTFPYGFLRFLVRGPRGGSRIIWPAASKSRGLGPRNQEGQVQTAGGTAILEGEIRPMNHDDDPREIVWTLSARGGDLMVRTRSGVRQLNGLTLDLRTEPGEPFETRISELASRMYEVPVSESDSFSLTVLDHDGKRRLHGRARILDCLALAKAEGTTREAA
jgi:uncharacterized protein (DUF58 family)